MTLHAMYEIILLALCIWREARDSSYDAQVAVGCSIKNRTLAPAWWNGHRANDYAAAILFPEQYSSFNPSDPNAVKLPSSTDTAFPTCLQIASDIHEEVQTDTVQGAQSYYSTDIPAPDWATTMTFVLQLGPFRFYRV